MAEINAGDYLDAADVLLRKLEEAKLASKKELEPVRQELTQQIKGDNAGAVERMQTINLGGNKVLVPNAANLRALNLSSNRSRERFSNFRLHYLNREQVDQLTADDSIPGDTRQFIRHSRRMARHAREFLGALQELEPDLEEEIQETLAQIEDNDMDLLKLQVRSFTRMRETLLRGAQGRKTREAVSAEVEAWDLNRNLWNLSLVEHPAAVVQGLLANSAEVMGSRQTTDETTLPKAAFLLAAPTPDAVTRMTPSSRTAQVAWRLFSAEQLDERFEKINTSRQAPPTSWRGLGLGYNTNEWFLPVPPEIAEGLRPLARERRTALLQSLEERGAL